jgi:transcriptional repressor NrdR
MKCSRCGSDRSSVLDSRADGDAIRRRRECQACGFRFTTFERVELSLPLVVKKDGRRENFDRKKIRIGILRACEKRPVSVEVVDRAVDALEYRLHEMSLKEIPSREIGDLVISALQSIDKIAYVRFASVYREFSDISQFIDTLSSLAQPKRKDTKKKAGKKKERKKNKKK